ncbi:MAG: GNAT family N-acetyltransferase, partial [Muribaculaceae bacterium]|nr:GNAT family N-acetyltransferase [Muribaculaceae bacterium]
MMIELKELNDIQPLMDWRKEVIRNVFGVDADTSLLEANRQYYISHIQDGRHIAYVASQDEVDCGCGGICFSDELPSPDN